MLHELDRVLTGAGRALASYVGSLLMPRPRMSPSTWCERHLVLPEGKSETEPGPVSFASRPYLREPIDVIEDPAVRDCIVVAPTRAGKTFIERMVYAYSVAADPANLLWVDSDLAAARKVSIKELQPLVDANRVLASRKPRNRHLYTNLLHVFPGAVVSMVGAQSVAGVAGETVMRVLGNEVDKWGDGGDIEASVLELCRHRTESFDDLRKHYFVSTPTLETGPIWTEYLRGDQRRFYCPCPHCGEFHQFTWDTPGEFQVRWDPEARLSDHEWDLERVLASGAVLCPCGAHLTEAERLAAVRDPRSHWRPTAKGQPGIRSYYLAPLLGPLKTNRPGQLAVDFLGARHTGFFFDRRDFWNSRMGLPWRDDISTVTVEKFATRELANVLRGDMPAGQQWDMVIFGADVQTYGLWWVGELYGPGGRHHTFDHGLAAGFADLEQIQADYLARFRLRSYVIIDINFEQRRAEAMEAIFRNLDRGWMAADGHEVAKEIVKIEKANAFMGGRLQGEERWVPRLIISTYLFKIELEKCLSGESKLWTTYQLPIAASETEIRDQKDFYGQLLDERRKPRKKRMVGKPVDEFVSRNGNNHMWDCKVYARALYYTLSRQRAHNSGGKPSAPAGRRIVQVAQ